MSSFAQVSHVSYYLPSRVLSNSQLEQELSGWSAAKILNKTGIEERRIAEPNELASDLAVHAVQSLFEKGVDSQSIDALIYCTQSPDYPLPSTACLLQERLNLDKRIAAFDVNLGCSGYVYCLGLAKGLIESHQANNVLVVTADTYSKYINPQDRSVRTLFGDGAAATLIESTQVSRESLGPFIYGTDGAGAGNLIVPAGGLKERYDGKAETCADDHGNYRTINNLYMNGGEIFDFTSRTVPKLFRDLLNKAKVEMDAIDLVIFHQANQFMLEHIRRQTGIPAHKCPVVMQRCGNTVSSSIPIALGMCEDNGTLRPGMRVMLIGFGVGYSWGGTFLTWKEQVRGQ